MADLEITLNGVSIPTNTSVTLTVLEDVGDDGGANTYTAQDGTTIDYDNSNSTTLTDGQTSYTLSGFDASGSNRVWPIYEPDNSDVELTAELTEATSVNTTGQTISAPVTDITVNTPTPTVTGEGAVSISADTTVISTTTPDPTVTAGGDVTIDAETTEIAVTTPAPTVQGTRLIDAPTTTVNVTTPTPTVGFDVTGTTWRIQRDQSTYESDLYDVEITDTANPFGNVAIAYIDDSDGTAFENYPRGTRVDFEVLNPTDGVGQYERRFTGYVVERRELDRNGADSLEVECYSFDQFLRRDTVSNDLNGLSIVDALESIITNDTPVTWDASNVTVEDPQTLTQSYRGDKVENAIQNIAAKSGSEAFGVNSDIEFFFNPRESSDSPRDIDNSQWFNYDIPEVGKEAVNEVTVYYDGGDKSVTVDNGADKLQLQSNIGTPDPVTQATEVTREDITELEDARALGEQILQNRNSTLTGTVTTYGLESASPGDIININIIPRGIDGNFRIAELEYNWGKDETTLTIVEKKGDQDRLLVRLSDTTKRNEMRQANRDATGNRITSTNVGVLLNSSGNVDGTDFESVRVTNTARNKLRDGWGGDGTIDITQIAVGDDGTSPNRSQTALGNELERVSATESLPDAQSVLYEADVTTTSIREIGLFDAAGDMVARATIPDTTLSGTIPIDFRIDIENDSSLERGVITLVGQTAVRDILADNNPSLPTKYAYGDDGTTPAETDTALGNAIHTEPIDSILVQDATNQSDWEDITDPTLPVKVENGMVQNAQTAWTIEAENEDASDGSTDQSNSDASNDTEELLAPIVGNYTQYEFTNEYSIPADDLEIQYRYFQDDVGTDGAPEMEIYLDGTQVGNVAPTGTSYFVGERDSGSADWQFGGTLDPGTHTLRFEIASAPSDPDVFVFDVVSIMDTTYNYTDLPLGSVSGRVAGPELYPHLTEAVIDSASTRRPLDSATATQVWNDTGNNQYIALSNDGGSNYIQTDNSQTATANFASSSTEVQTKVGISRYSTGTNQTPAQGNATQAIDSHELSANVASITAANTGTADVRALIAPGTITAGTTLREGGELDTNDNLLTHTIFAQFDLGGSQRLVSSERVTWSNP